MFLGTHTPRLDDKGRLILPAKFRDKLAGGLVVTRGLGHRRPLWDPAVVKQVTEFAASAADGIRAESARASRA